MSAEDKPQKAKPINPWDGDPSLRRMVAETQSALPDKPASSDQTSNVSRWLDQWKADPKLMATRSASVQDKKEDDNNK